MLGSAILSLIGAGCAREEAPGVLAPNEAPGSGQWQGQSPYAPGTAGAPTLLSPATGVACASDADPQCPFSRCIGGRCGGCASSGDCKPGSACVWTPLGPSCILAGLSAPSPAPAPGPPPGAAYPPAPSYGPYSAARQICVDRTNEFRARAGMRPLVRRTQSEPCIDQQAQSDAQTRATHGAFGRCGELAQNECPAWGAAPEATATNCLQSMFNEGPGTGSAHGHYNNMTSGKYASVACGFHVTPEGRTWMIQDFFPN
jgi:hypothetical protein